MNKADLARACAGKLGGQVAAHDAIGVIFDAIIREVSTGGRVVLTGFGTFEAVKRGPRKARNLRTGESVAVAAAVVPKFRPSPAFTAYVGQPGELPEGRSAAARKPVRKAAGR